MDLTNCQGATDLLRKQSALPVPAAAGVANPEIDENALSRQLAGSHTDSGGSAGSHTGAVSVRAWRTSQDQRCNSGNQWYGSLGHRDRQGGVSGCSPFSESID